MLVLAYRSSHTAAPVSDQRYEPLPGFDQLPAWLWRRTGTRARLAIGGAVLLAIAMAVVLIPAAQQAQRDRAAAESTERAQRRAQSIRALQAQQQPRFGRSDSVAAPAAVAVAHRGAPVAAGETRQARMGAVVDLETAIAVDARTRGLDGRVRRATCEPFPATVGKPPPEQDLRRRRGSYACLAITSEIERTARNAAGVLGHPYRAAIDFETGRYAFCKVVGRPDPIPDPKVVTPKPCSA